MKSFDIVLATASPRRRLLIRRIGRINPIFMPMDVEEVTLSGAEQTAAANARKKGEAAMKKTELPVLAFDTVVGLNDIVYGKPETYDDAVRMLKSLCGNTHEVVTAVFFAVNGKIIEKTEKTHVTFGAFDKDLVYNYVESGAPFDKAGGYNIDDPQIKPLITAVDGDYDNVVGLPVKLTEKLIEENLIYGEDGYRA
ncbi:MAG: septum formation protein Maf [Clostridiales bacterium]|nr:septum formation protein Maf [Clostridiales bacterium]